MYTVLLILTLWITTGAPVKPIYGSNPPRHLPVNFQH